MPWARGRASRFKALSVANCVTLVGQPPPMTIAGLVLSLKDQLLYNTAQSALFALLAVPLVYLFVNELVRNNARISGMKGPPGWPLIGNFWDIRVNAAEKYRDSVRSFGDIYQIQLGNVPVVVINSAAAARAIFGQNAQTMSSRPEFYTFHKVRMPEPLASPHFQPTTP